MFAMDPRRERRQALLARQLAFFSGDVRKTFAAMALTCRPSTLATAAAIAPILRPDARADIKIIAAYAAKAKRMPEGRPQQAVRFSVQALRQALGTASQRIRDAIIFMWTTVSRSIDLFHYEVVKVDDLWRLTMIPRLEADGRLVAPKSDPRCRTTIIKWVRPHPLFRPAAVLANPPSWEELRPFMSQLGSTPHAIRGTAIEFLERQWYNTSSIQSLSGHAPAGEVEGLQNYLAFRPGDRASRMSVKLSTLLIEALV